MSDPNEMSVATTVAIGVGAAAVLGFIGYAAYKSSRNGLLGAVRKNYRSWDDASLVESGTRYAVDAEQELGAAAHAMSVYRSLMDEQRYQDAADVSKRARQHWQDASDALQGTRVVSTNLTNRLATRAKRVAGGLNALSSDQQERLTELQRQASLLSRDPSRWRSQLQQLNREIGAMKAEGGLNALIAGTDPPITIPDNYVRSSWGRTGLPGEVAIGEEAFFPTRTWPGGDLSYRQFLNQATTEQLMGEVAGLGVEFDNFSRARQDGTYPKWAQKGAKEAAGAMVRAAKALPAAADRRARRK
jgi:hypothetical protein